jgi:hypothetical protein
LAKLDCAALCLLVPINFPLKLSSNSMEAQRQLQERRCRITDIDLSNFLRDNEGMDDIDVILKIHKLNRIFIQDQVWVFCAH